jgi:hypothetical protein
VSYRSPSVANTVALPVRSLSNAQAGSELPAACRAPRCVDCVHEASTNNQNELNPIIVGKIIEMLTLEVGFF